MAENTPQDFFDSQNKPEAPPAEQKKPRKPRSARKPPAEAAPVADKPKRERKKRAAPAGNGAAPKKERKKREPRAAKVALDVAISALAGLKPDEAQMVAAAAGKLGTMPKRSRGRIVAALARMFA